MLQERTATLGPGDPVHPHRWKTLHRDLDAASRRADIPKATGHDLRRSFGRIAFCAGASSVDLKHLYGHESVDTTASHIGLDESQMRVTIGRFESAVAEALSAGA